MYLAQKICLLVAVCFASATLDAQTNTFAAAKDNTTDRAKIIDPVVKVKSRNDKSVIVAWRAYTGDVSQYILERSIDGRRYVELTAFVAVMNNDEPYYEFADRFKSSYTGPLFYRVRVEGLDGGVIYTPVTILKAVNQAAN